MHIFFKKKIPIKVFKQKKRSQNFKIFIIGSGTHALSNIIPNILTLNFIIEKIYVRNHSKAKLIEKIFDIKCTTDINDIFFDIKKNDKLFILTNSGSHHKYLEMFSKKKCYIFLEKPLTNSLENFKKIINFKKDIYEKKILIGFNRNFSKAYILLRKLLNKSNQKFELNYRINFGNMKNETVNHFIENCCHYIFFIISITEKQIEEFKIFNDKSYYNNHVIIRFMMTLSLNAIFN